MKKNIISLLLVSVFSFACSTKPFVTTELEQTNIESVNKNYIPIFTSKDDWGTRAQISAVYEDLLDIQGNKDGIWDNEKEGVGKVSGVGTTLPLKPWFDKFAEQAKAELSTTNVLKELQDYLSKKESTWGKKVTDLDASKLKSNKLFSVQKSIYLERFNRTPDQVKDFFVTASGKVNNVTISPREVFCQRFIPNNPNGKMLVFSPGFQETGRNFYEQADKLNKLGFDVILMDHQWSGQTKGGVDGTLDRGFGVARDVASVAAYASKLLEKIYSNKSNKELILVGNSMGAGPGVLSAVTLNDNGKISLSGDQMPIGLRAVLQSPFLATILSMINSSILAFSNVPFVKSLALYSSGLPILTHDPVAAQKGTQVALTEDIRAQLKTMVVANEDINFVIDMIKNGQEHKGKVSIIQADKDPLADSKKVSEVASRFSKDRVNLRMINSNNHVFEQSPTEQNYLIDTISKL